MALVVQKIFPMDYKVEVGNRVGHSFSRLVHYKPCSYKPLYFLCFIYFSFIFLDISTVHIKTSQFITNIYLELYMV